MLLSGACPGLGIIPELLYGELLLPITCLQLLELIIGGARTLCDPFEDRCPVSDPSTSQVLEDGTLLSTRSGFPEISYVTRAALTN